jgi:hypothetical protein
VKFSPAHFIFLILAVSLGFLEANAQNAKWAAVISCKKREGIVGSYEVRMDKSNNVYVFGIFENAPIYFSPKDSLTPIEYSWGEKSAAYIAKYNSKGQILWYKKLIRIGRSHFYDGFEVDKEGNVWLSLISKGSRLYFDSLSFKGDGCLVKFNSEGKTLWVTESGAGGVLALDEKGNAYVQGQFRDSITIAGTKFTGPHDYASYLIKYSPSGGIEWVNYIGVYRYPVMSVDKSGAVYLTNGTGQFADLGKKIVYGFGQNNIQLTKYNPDGSLAWVKLFQCTTPPLARASAILNSGNLMVSLSIVGTIDLGTYLVVSEAFHVTAEIDSSGKILWATNKQLTGSNILPDVCNGFFSEGHSEGKRGELFKDSTLSKGTYLVYYNAQRHAEFAAFMDDYSVIADVGSGNPDLALARTIARDADDYNAPGDVVLYGHHISSIEGNHPGYTCIFYFDRGVAYKDGRCFHTLSIDEANQSMSIFPNPASRYITIVTNTEIKGEIHASLVDLNGRQIQLTTNPMRNQFRTTLTLPSIIVPGVYLLKTENEGSVKIFKVFITR